MVPAVFVAFLPIAGVDQQALPKENRNALLSFPDLGAAFLPSAIRAEQLRRVAAAQQRQHKPVAASVRPTLKADRITIGCACSLHPWELPGASGLKVCLRSFKSGNDAFGDLGKYVETLTHRRTLSTS